VKNSKYPSKYGGYFCQAIGNTGFISSALLTDCLCSFGQFAFKVISSCTVFVSARTGALGYGKLFCGTFHGKEKWWRALFYAIMYRLRAA